MNVSQPHVKTTVVMISEPTNIATEKRMRILRLSLPTQPQAFGPPDPWIGNRSAMAEFVAAHKVRRQNFQSHHQFKNFDGASNIAPKHTRQREQN